MEYPTWLSNLKILLDYNKPGTEYAEISNFSIAVDPALKRDRYPGNGKALSSLSCYKATYHRFFRGMVANSDDLFPEGLCCFAFRPLSEKQNREK